MKQKEIVLIAVVVIISGTLSLVLTNTILVSKKEQATNSGSRRSYWQRIPRT